jgi:hypothetical protein
MRHPHMQFILGLGLIGPLCAIAGVSAGGLWVGVGLALAGLVVAATAWRSNRHTFHDRDLHQFFRWRMLAVTGIVAAAALALTGGALAWLVQRLVE